MKLVKRVHGICPGKGLLFLFAMTLTGCLGSSTPSTFYMLRSMEGASPAETSASGRNKTVSLLLGPISLPGYLDRTQMVTLAGKNQLDMYEFSRWAESLQEGFYRVLQEDLSTLLGTPAVYRYDRGNFTTADYQLIIDVSRFDAVSGGEAVLKAFWTLRCKETDRAGITRQFVFRTPVSGVGFPGLVNAQNDTLSAFGREIAKMIRSMVD